MWIYDGENWIREESGQDQERNDERTRWREGLLPELQIVPRNEVERPVIPFPVPLPSPVSRKRERKIGHA